MGLDEVQVSVFRQEGHQLVIGPEMEENYLLLTGKHMVTEHVEDNYANKSTCSWLLQKSSWNLLYFGHLEKHKLVVITTLTYHSFYVDMANLFAKSFFYFIWLLCFWYPSDNCKQDSFFTLCIINLKSMEVLHPQNCARTLKNLFLFS